MQDFSIRDRTIHEKLMLIIFLNNIILPLVGCKFSREEIVDLSTHSLSNWFNLTLFLKKYITLYYTYKLHMKNR